ncbi:hypothetical protein ALC56_09075 [Trachymyrmex septentrionalis]|uniref:Uncharacterized protein n=1 Tax=Trachymyrmex septentrionalis TaxID=34720 RepID=A0A151JUS6_9HYME|nr:hypothetical protein ALC56_09075 [Trachymyrmex septentrionalis]
MEKKSKWRMGKRDRLGGEDKRIRGGGITKEHSPSSTSRSTVGERQKREEEGDEMVEKSGEREKERERRLKEEEKMKHGAPFHRLYL